MLILTRKVGESVYIILGDDPVKVVVVELKGNQIRLGVDAHSKVKIYREEIWDQICEENRSAAASEGNIEGLSDAWKGTGSGAMSKLSGGVATGTKLGSGTITTQKKK